MQKKEKRKPSCISLFSGAGGLDLGLEQAGFEIKLCVESDPVARKTIRMNDRSWPLSEPGDIHCITAHEILLQAGVRERQLDLLAGGPPCQPFSKAGYWVNGAAQRMKDRRARTLREYLEVVRCALPKVLLLENVQGLAFSGKDEGLKFLERELRSINKERGVNYRPHLLRLNAADYGVPQLRERLFVVAHRNGKEFLHPPRTYAPPDQISGGLRPYRTAWEAIGDLDSPAKGSELRVTGRWADLLPSVPEGSNYLWHTRRGGGEPIFGWRTRYWSFLLKLSKRLPSWTIQAQPGPAVGPFHWRNRRLSTRELCRLQTFPDGYEIRGSYREIYQQIGNAVPPVIGQLLGLQIRKQLLSGSRVPALKLPPKVCIPCAKRTRVARIPGKYQRLIGTHRDHPGEGRGPRARRRRRLRAAR